MLKNFTENDDFEEADDFDIFGSFEEDEISGRIADDVDVEKIVKAIRRCTKEVDFLKKLKANRVAPIDEKIAKLTSNESKLRNFAIDLMGIHFPDRNTVDFPGVGKLTKRKVKGKWEVVDEEQFIQFLKDNKCDKDVVVNKEVLSKKEIPKVMSEIIKVMAEDDVIGAKYVEPERDIALTVKLYDRVSEVKQSDEETGF